MPYRQNSRWRKDNQKSQDARHGVVSLSVCTPSRALWICYVRACGHDNVTTPSTINDARSMFLTSLRAAHSSLAHKHPIPHQLARSCLTRNSLRACALAVIVYAPVASSPWPPSVQRADRRCPCSSSCQPRVPAVFAPRWESCCPKQAYEREDLRTGRR